MSYKLADGSLSTDYEVGDEFVVTARQNDVAYIEGCLISLYEDDESAMPLFKTVEGVCAYNNAGEGSGAWVEWRTLTPTPGTKRKVQARRPKPPAFTITTGDYIDSREFTREECERFCELAVECGFERSSAIGRKITRRWWAVGTSAIGGCVFAYDVPSHHFTTNITPQFREFLDKENSMFTKDDLKDGMRVINREGNERIILGGKLYKEGDHDLSYQSSIGLYGSDLTDNVAFCLDIMKVTDRDGTVLFERKPEKRKVTFELTEEQERELRKQLAQ